MPLNLPRLHHFFLLLPTTTTTSNHLLRIRLADGWDLRREPLLKGRRNKKPIRVEPARKRRRYLQHPRFFPRFPIADLQVIDRFMLFDARCDGYLV